MEVWQTSNLWRLRLGEEKKKEEEEERRRTNHSMKIYMVSLLHRATINESQLNLLTLTVGIMMDYSELRLHAGIGVAAIPWR